VNPDGTKEKHCRGRQKPNGKEVISRAILERNSGKEEKRATLITKKEIRGEKRTKEKPPTSFFSMAGINRRETF